MYILSSVIIGIIDWVFAILFIYYALKNAVILRRTYSQYSLAVGAFLFNVVGIICFIKYTAHYAPPEFLIFILFAAGTMFVLWDSLFSVIIISRVHKTRLLELIRIIPHVMHRFIGLFVLMFLTLPCWVTYLLHNHGSLWGTLALLSSTSAFIIFAMSERKLYRSIKQKTVASLDDKSELLLREDIIMTNNYIILINTFLTMTKSILGYRLLENAIDAFLEGNPIIFNNVDIKKGKEINLIPIITNLNRIYAKERIDIISRTFFVLNSEIIKLCGTITSPKYAKEIFEKSYMVVKNRLKNKTIILEILRTFPENILEKERLTLLSKEELEEKVENRTKELENERLFSENVLETIPDSLLVLDKTLKIVTANQSIEQMFHIDHRKVKGWNIAELLANETREIEDVKNKLIEVIETGKLLKNFKIHYKKKTLDVTVRKIKLDIGEILVIFKDITEKEELEQQLIQIEKFKTLEQLAFGLTHQIKNPLAIISGYAQLISKDTEIEKINNKDILDNVSIIQEQVTRASNLVTNLLNFTKHTEMNFTKVNVCLLLDKTISLYEHAFTEHNIIIKRNYTYSPNLLDVEADESQFMEIFSVVINNSIESMATSGELEVLTNMSEDNSQIDIKIRDTGCGIRQRDLDKIFTPFFTTKTKGTGLGLFYSKIIISRHKGSITINSKEGKGTEVSIKLPVCQN
ncbi:MAG: ATP-binding protein [bacterium]|nr:ATP-binding protein [bacterium]